MHALELHPQSEQEILDIILAIVTICEAWTCLESTLYGLRVFQTIAQTGPRLSLSIEYELLHLNMKKTVGERAKLVSALREALKDLKRLVL